jgi:hypothetical protein
MTSRYSYKQWTFLDMILKAQETRQKKDKFDYIKLRWENFCNEKKQLAELRNNLDNEGGLQTIHPTMD